MTKGPAHPDLTGRWLGRYQYDSAAPVVAFEADLEEFAGALTGEIREPNSFRPDQGAELSASLTGSRAGTAVDFVKVYRGFTQGDHPHYSGTTNPALTRIEGQWHFLRAPWMRGRFVMMRKPLASAETATTIGAERLEPVGG